MPGLNETTPLGGLGTVLIWDVGPGLAPARPPQGVALQSI